MKTVVAIVVNYNAGAWLERSVSALLASRYPVQVYVVDNASVDNSLALVREKFADSANLHLVENKENLGFSAANNIVLNSASADYYVLINPDCIVETGTIGYMVESMDQDPQAGLAGTRILNEDGSAQKTSRRRFPTPENTFVKTLGLGRWFGEREKYANYDFGDQDDNGQKQYVEAISGAFMVVSQDALKQVGGLDEGYFMHCEDLDWCKRFWLHGHKVAFYPGSSVVHGKGGSSQSSPYRVNWHLHNGMLRFYKKFYRSEYPALVSGLVYCAVTGRYLLSNGKIFLGRLFGKR